MLKFRYQIKGATDARIKKKLLEIGVLKKSEAREIATAVEKEMRKLIANGTSPVRGKGYRPKFPKYKNPKKYPGDRKPKSPVNLELTGHMLNNLGSRAVKIGKSWVASIGYDNALAKKKESGHREGVNGQPSRPTIPRTTDGERFAPSILDAVLKKLREILRRRSRSN